MMAGDRICSGGHTRQEGGSEKSPVDHKTKTNCEISHTVAVFKTLARVILAFLQRARFTHLHHRASPRVQGHGSPIRGHVGLPEHQTCCPSAVVVRTLS